MRKKSRTQKAMLNTACEIGLEIVAAICGLILPRLILSNFGSAYNGITHSISQFISCIALLKSGIGSVTRASLYKPLADHDSDGISEVVTATESFMRRIALIFLGFVLVFAAVYPFIVKDDFDWFFVFSLVLILSVSTFAQYYFGLAHQMVLQADQCNYIISLVSIASTVLNTIIASSLILLGCGIHAVKLGSAAVFICPPIFYSIYVKKKYHLYKSKKPNLNLISQRWDAFGHQLANFINNNTDIIVATVFLGIKEVSVYSVHYTVANTMRKAVIAVSSGTTAAFGNMIAKEETDNLKRRFSQFELLIFVLGTILFTTTAILFVPFISIYTRGVEDVNYIRPGFAIIFCIAEFFACTKLPYEQLVFAAGKFKATKKGAYIEAILNIVISVILVKPLGLIGILVGTTFAVVYRMMRYNIFISQNLIDRSPLLILYKILYTCICSISCYLVCSFLPFANPTNYFNWILMAIPSFVIVLLVSTILSLIMFRNDTVELFRTITHVFFKKQRKEKK